MERDRMITASFSDGTVKTEGCGCCAATYRPENNLERLKDDLIEMLELVKKACERYSLDFEELLQECD